MRDVPSPATGTQGYQIQASLPVGTSDCISHLPPVKAKPLRGGWFCALVKRCRLRKSRDIILVKAGWICFSLALNQGPGCCKKQWNWPGGVETILSEIFIESMERLCILRKDSIELKNIRKWMEGKIPVLHELSIHSGLLPKSDGPETTVWHNFYIYFGLAAISVGLRKLLSPSFFWFSLIRWHSSLKMQK